MKETKYMTAKQMACPLTKGQRILVAVDGSSNSDLAVEQALSMATTCNSKFYAITVVDVYPIYMEGAPGVKKKAEKEARNILKKVEEKAKKQNIACETILHIGHQPHEFIVREAKERNIDLIVMGTHGRTGLEKFVMGSVAQKVIAYAPSPVMVVPG